MNKKGFTLIELLAVIVILAIIALIATPIVLNIIDDAKKESDLRSAEFYLKSLELSIAQATLKGTNIKDKVYNILKNGNVCLEKYEGKICKDEDGNPNNNELVVEVKGKKATLGTIVIENGQIVDKLSTDESKKTEFEINEQKIIMKGGELKYPEKTEESKSICKLQEGYTANEIGSKYECEVKPGTKYNFYVISKEEDGTTNLIMDQNINSDGTPAGMTGTTKNGDNVYNLVAWNSSGSNTGGPVTAMQFLYNATKDWTNIDPITYEYKDKEYQGTTNANTSYTSFKAEAGVLTITPLSGTATTIGSETEPLRVRMPIYSAEWDNDLEVKITEKGEVADKTANNTYLYDNLDPAAMDAPYGYWTLSSDAYFSYNAWYVGYVGYVYSAGVVNASRYGARPVINLKL